MYRVPTYILAAIDVDVLLPYLTGRAPYAYLSTL
jgi:hypothetical protein